MRALFIIHSTNMIYGASKSLSVVTQNWGSEFDIMFPKDFPRDFCKKQDKTLIIEEAKRVYGSNLRSIYFSWLPFVFPFKVDYKSTLKWKIKYTVNYILGITFRNIVYRIIKSNKYDFIHLNSIILYPLIKKRQNVFIHVREVTDAGNLWIRRIGKRLADAKGVIFIDEATREPFDQRWSQNNSIVLNNPFDMRKVIEIKTSVTKSQYGIQENETVYAIIGAVSEIKGILFVIDAFRKVNSTSKLLVVGTGSSEYVERCKNEAKDDNRIVFIGEIKDVTSIYAISDYIIRGDYCFGIGRTIYEGLYAGKSVIIPGCEADQEKVFDYDTYKDFVHFYKPRDQESLIEIIEMYSNLRKTSGIPRSNVKEYLDVFGEFTNIILKKEEDNK